MAAVRNGHCDHQNGTSRAYKVDPVLAISDASPFAKKLKSDAEGNLLVKDLDAMASGAKFVGAGYGYLLGE
jgi:hypothetical protein